MPVPQTAPARRLTSATFRDPFRTVLRPFGAGGLNLRDAVDQLGPEEYTKATNVLMRGIGEVEARPGQSSVATSGGTKVHSFARLADPFSDVATRVWGIDAALYIGLQGALTQVDTGYSGDPLTLVPFRPTHSGESWMYVADRTRMRKVRRDGTDLPIGFPVAVLSAVAQVAEETTDLVLFRVSDESAASVWSRNLGTSESAGTLNDVGSPGGLAVEFVIHNTAAADDDGVVVPRYTYFGLTRPLDLTQVGTRDAEDADNIHLWLMLAFPSKIEEVRLYFVCSDDFDATILPGTSATANREYYVKAFRPGDLAQWATGVSSLTALADATQRKADETYLQQDRIFTEEELEARGLLPREDDIIDDAVDLTRAVPAAAGAGQYEWVEFGIAGRPLRRGDFVRQGRSSDDRNWGTVTGIVIAITVVPGTPLNSVALSNCYLTGGYGPDSSSVGAKKFDVRVTHFDPRTGDEGNGSEVQDEEDWIDTVRRALIITPTAFGDAAVRQRIYVRGGTNNDDWARVGVNEADGGAFTFDQDDDEVSTLDTLELDHDQPITTVDSDGETVLAQAIPVLIDMGDLLFGLGDPYRPGHLYWCKVDQPGHWPPQNTLELCPPSEELMGGVPWGGQAYVFSRARMFVAYPNLMTPGTVVSTNTACRRGLISRWAATVGEAGIYGVDGFGIFITTGGVATEIADTLYPLFHQESKYGYDPVDFSEPEAMRLRAADGRLFFHYRDTGGVNRVLVYHERRRYWEALWQFGQAIATIEVEPIRTGQVTRVFVGGRTSGVGYELAIDTKNDAGTAISAVLQTGAIAGPTPREEKLYGDLIIEVSSDTTDLTVQTFVNELAITNPAQLVNSGADRERFALDAFGTTPQQARNVALAISWSATARRPMVHGWGVSEILHPDIVLKRPTQWDDIGSAQEKYLTGVMIEADTFGVACTLLVEGDLDGATTTVATITITHSGRHRRFYSWAVKKVQAVRLRPDPSNDCVAWQPFEIAWIAHEEPPRLAQVDSGDENRWDTYYTGLDLDIDTFNVAKTFEIYVDQTLVATESVTTNGRRVHHISLTPAYGHVYRYVATDSNDCLLYAHRWHLTDQPSEQTNWNQGFTVANTRADKWIKGVKLEIDTFNVAKAVTIEIDGTALATFNVTADGRRVIQHAITQTRGRVVRVYSVDGVAARLWDPVDLIFDEEPLALTRWETQYQNYGIPGWMTPLYAYLMLESSAEVTWTRTTVIGEDGTEVSDTLAVISSTGGAKQKRRVNFPARKGLLFKDVFTSAVAFYIHRGESELMIQPWGGAVAVPVQPFGGDDQDVRGQRLSADLVAARLRS